MVKFINHVTGSVMWIHENRVQEYLALGDRPAEPLPSAAPVLPVSEPPKPEAKKKPPTAKKKPKAEEW